MSVVSRKQREIQEREKKLIQIGRELLLKDGLHGLKLDRVADIAEYSRALSTNTSDPRKICLLRWRLKAATPIRTI